MNAARRPATSWRAACNSRSAADAAALAPRAARHAWVTHQRYPFGTRLPAPAAIQCFEWRERNRVQNATSESREGSAPEAGDARRERDCRRDRDRLGHFRAAEPDRAKPAFGPRDPRRLDGGGRALVFRRAGVCRIGRDAAGHGRSIRLPSRSVRSAVRLRVRLDVHAGGDCRRQRLAGRHIRHLCRLLLPANARSRPRSCQLRSSRRLPRSITSECTQAHWCSAPSQA